MKKCEVYGCNNLCQDSQLMCKGHWSLVPKDLQKQVNDKWQRVQGARAGGTAIALRDAMYEHRQAKLAAIESVL